MSCSRSLVFKLPDTAAQEIVDYEAEEAPVDTAPVAETQQTDAPEADAAATAAADDAANKDHAEVPHSCPVPCPVVLFASLNVISPRQRGD